ncbi:hypothetical protein [Streptomyces antibioticus]|uniref:hypothetical protein n=1 Tax=Streptomyces antibioticus TaxID=1890 RepID=UPI00340F119D
MTCTTWPASLREISKDLSGYARRGTAIVLRSLFRASEREGKIVRNPARNLPVGDLKGIARSIPSDRLMGLLDHAGTPLGRFVVALTSIIHVRASA